MANDAHLTVCYMVLQIDVGIVTIPLFGIDIPTSSQCIRFHSEPTRAESDHEIELGKEL